MVSQVQRSSAQPSLSQEVMPLLKSSLRSAEAAIQANDWSQAVAHAQQAIRLQPTAAAYKLLGNALLHQQQWQEAEAAYEQALQLQPDSAELYANLGTLAAHQQHWAEALQHFRQAIALKPELASRLQQNLEQTWTQIQRSTVAQQAFFSQPDRFAAIDHQTLGDYWIQQGQLEAAVRCYENAVAIDPSLATAYWNLSLAQKQLGNAQAMLKAYAQALALQPDWATAAEHTQLGNHFLQQEQWQQAIECYERAIRLDGALADAHFGLGTALQKQGDWQGATAAYQTAIDLQPEMWLAHHNLGDVLLAQKQWLSAIAAYERSLALNPNHSWSYNNLGDAYRQLSRWQEAVEAYQNAIRLYPDFHWSHYNLGDALMKLEQWDQAIEAYRSATVLNPDLTIAHRKLSQALHKRAESDLAAALNSYLYLIQHDPYDVESYHGALQIKRDDPQLHVGLANALVSKNQLDQAIVFYQNALLLQPDHVEAKIQLDHLLEQKEQTSEALGFSVHSADYALWLQENVPQPADLMCYSRQVANFKYKPLISVVVPVYNPPEQFLREMIQSVLDQIYPYWELCIADDCSTKPYVRKVLDSYAAKDTRIKVTYRETNGHISAASNSALRLATGEYITLLDHDDLLTPDALYEVVSLLNEHPEADLIYSDEDTVNEQRELLNPYFKPDWCPDFLLSQNYICHLSTYRRTIINQIGGFRVGYEGSQDYDLVLRFTEKTNNIFHIPKVLYHWRVHPESVASGPEVKPYAYNAAARALQDALNRRGEQGEVLRHPTAAGVYTVRYSIRDYKKVSIIIPSRNLGNVLDRCLNSIFEKSTYPNYEVIVVDNGSDEAETLKIFADWQQQEPERFRCHRLDIPFNYSRLNNYGVAQASGDYLLFLNNDTEVVAPDWIEAMVEQAQRLSVGAIGALLLYPDDTIQHAGVILGLGGAAAHSHKYFPKDCPGYFNKLLCVSNYSAVTGACIMCRRDAYEQVGGFNETLKVAFNDVDFCLRLKQQGYNNVLLPHVLLYHHESKSRGAEDTPEKQRRFEQEKSVLGELWADIIAHDPCYSPNLTRDYENYSLKILNRPDILEVTLSEPVGAFLDFSIDSPTVGKLQGGFVTIDGWILGRECRATAIKVICNNLLIHQINVNGLRPDVKQAFPHVSGAEQSGFTISLKVTDLPKEAEILLKAAFEDGIDREMGKIVVRHLL